MNKKLFLFLVLSAIMQTQNLFAQANYTDAIYLKNGSIIRGTIIEQVPNQSLKIETADRNVFVYELSEVDKIIKEQASASTTATVKLEEDLNCDFVGGRRMYLSFGGGSNMLGDIGFGEAKFEIGYYLNPHQRLSIEFGGGSYTEKEVGWFSYRYGAGGSLHNDGKINYEYASFQYLVSWSYIKELSDRFQWRVGPSLGGLNISAGFAYNPSGLDGEPPKQSISKSSVIFGANTGITWNFSPKKCWFLDLGYRLYGCGNISFDKRTLDFLGYTIPVEEKTFANVGNQIMLTIGWRFSKVHN